MIEYISVHNSGGKEGNRLAPASDLTLQSLNNVHRARWPDLPSELTGEYTGYTISILRDGSHHQHRYIGEEGAHTKGYNKTAVGIHLFGNFTKGVESPTIAQQMKFKAMVRAIKDGKPELFNLQVKPGTVIAIKKIAPHRLFQINHTDCYGSSLSDSWASDLVNIPGNNIDERISLMKIIVDLYRKILQLRGHVGRAILGIKLENCSSADVRG